jgi:predicted unusual protein kinase regulating ubiquinone biosynthesis (AarF/ABC1/UbiB family)
MVTPVDLILMGRALGLLDGITKQLDPSLDALEVITAYIPHTLEGAANDV